MFFLIVCCAERFGDVQRVSTKISYPVGVEFALNRLVVGRWPAMINVRSWPLAAADDQREESATGGWRLAIGHGGRACVFSLRLL